MLGSERPRGDLNRNIELARQTEDRFGNWLCTPCNFGRQEQGPSEEIACLLLRRRPGTAAHRAPALRADVVVDMSELMRDPKAQAVTRQAVTFWAA
jgi:hypothetical protein